MAKRTRHNMVSEPRSSEEKYERYTAQLDSWLPRVVEFGTPDGELRMERFLAYFNLESSGGNEIFLRVDEASHMTSEECQATFATQPAHLEKLKKMELSLQQWEVAKVLVRRLMPSATLNEAESYLTELTRDAKSETHLEFCRRYRRTAQTFVKDDKITASRSMHILYYKLPPLLMSMVHFRLDLDSATLEEVVTVVG